MEIIPSDVIKTLPKQEFSLVFQKVKEMEKTGAQIINLGQGNPDLPTPPHIVETLREAALNPSYHGYGPFRGYPFLKEAIAEFYEREYGVSVNPETEVALFGGGKAGLYVLTQCLLNPGDIALVPNPGYPEYLSGITMARAELHEMPLYPENGYLPDFERIDPAVLKKAKLMFLNYPNNPTGATADQAFYEKAAAFAKKHDIHLIHDFAYGAFEFDQNPASFLQAKEAKTVGAELYSFSKTFNMAGWRMAFAVGNEKIIQAVNEFQDHVFVGMFGGLQQAAAAALSGNPEHTERLKRTYKERIDFFTALCEKELGWSIEKPKGTFYVWAEIPNEFESSHQFSDYLLEHAHVVVTPGEIFGSGGKRYVRISMVAKQGDLREFVLRIQKLGLSFPSLQETSR
ncbi:pyridoxal phosphate-dependent aminotransferase [Bacillus velezensis]|uniref:pyridoxal phosphate-dependent aminotransferase n=1 Tax=Bacillus velezensis TaxID=492670 RepID=UPI001BCF437C|nr:pyridoxal phosphate-dependent aminotransferase [Bacillus velezensis]QVL39317.1 pyridoxal phosphate-dependent aminotransferase [Bacillus velezensis]